MQNFLIKIDEMDFETKTLENIEEQIYNWLDKLEQNYKQIFNIKILDDDDKEIDLNYDQIISYVNGKLWDDYQNYLQYRNMTDNEYYGVDFYA